jgi:signal transduction histidine kinase
VFNTIFRKLVAVLLLFGLLMSLIFGMIMRYSHAVYHQEIQQKFHVGIATRFAELAGWTPFGWADPNAVTAALARLVTANPQFHVYILDRDGLVLSHYPDNIPLASNRVSLQPIKQILHSKPHLPILGDDPADIHRQQIFSAARLQGRTRPEQYLYVTLRSEEDDESAKGLRLTYITREGALLIGASVILALAGGLLSLHFVVRPLKQLASTMDGFRENHFRDGLTDSKKPAASSDEIDAISAAFYRMAEQIQTQMREIAQADSSRREFIANVSHDLRTPLASIQGYLGKP